MQPLNVDLRLILKSTLRTIIQIFLNVRLCGMMGDSMMIAFFLVQFEPCGKSSQKLEIHHGFQILTI